MRTIIIIKIFLFLTIFSFSCKESTIFTPITNLNLRSQPSLKGDIKRVLKPGEKLVFVSQKKVWVQVTTTDNTSGWVHANYLKEIRDDNIKSSGKSKSSFFKMRIKESWHTIKSYAIVFYFFLFITIGIFVSEVMGLNPGAGVVFGIIGYMFLNFSVVTFNRNIALFAVINIALGAISIVFTGITQGRESEDNVINYFTGIVTPLLAIGIGIVPGFQKYYILYIIFFALGFLTSFEALSDFFEDIVNIDSSNSLIIILLAILSIFSVAHLPKIWPPMIFVQGILGILGFIAGKNE